MKIQTYTAYNPDAREDIDLREYVTKALTDTVKHVKYVGMKSPDITSAYISALEKRLANVGGEINFDLSLIDLDEVFDDFPVKKEVPGLLNLVIGFLLQQLGLGDDYQPGEDKIEVLCFNKIKFQERLTYHIARACADVLGDEKGIQLWKEIVARKHEDQMVVYKKRVQERLEQGKVIPTVKENIQDAIDYWSSIGIADFTVAVMDDNMNLCRFDRCMVVEVLEDFNDPEFAYLCSCYHGDIEGYNDGRVIHMRRSQTLHQGDFCDEFYWNPEVYKNPEQPSLEFTRNLGEEKEQV